MVGSPSKALILAAGRGSRLGAITAHLHKGLLKISDETILEILVRTFKVCGLHPVVIVTGHQANKVRDAVGADAHYVHNPSYAEAGIMRSLQYASAMVAGDPFVLAMGDHLFDSRLVRACAGSDSDVTIGLEEVTAVEQADVKVQVRDATIVEHGKRLDATRITHQFAGLASFSERGSLKFFEQVSRLDDGTRPNPLAFDAIVETAEQPSMAVSLLAIPPGQRLEVDTIADLRRARQVVVDGGIETG